MRTHFKLWWQNKQARLFIVLLLTYIVSGLYSQNSHSWWVNTQNKLPLLAIPFGWVFIELELKKWMKAFLYAFVVILCVAALAVLANYFFHFNTLNNSIKLGHAIPTPMHDHIRFSLELSFAALIGLYLLPTSTVKSTWGILLLLMISILITTIHVLAVRSGLLALYSGGFLWVLHQIINRNNWRKGVVVLGVSLFCVFIAFRTVPTLHNKVSYFQYEWSLISKGEMKEGHSDAQRLQSTLYGWDVALENLPIGTGSGDIRSAMAAEYAGHEQTVGMKYELPHNQFVYALAAIGVAGFLALLLAFLFPLSQKKQRSSWIMQAFLFIICISFMTEHVLEIQIGITFVMLFSVLLPSAIFTKSKDPHAEN
jgi:O-antigen ligase